MTSLEEILASLIAYPSVTPEDKGCQDYMMDYLRQLGFVCQSLPQAPVSNFFACYGHEGPLFVFAGHTDVVPVGDINSWHSKPFELTQQGDILYGRGVADMKGSLACMLHAAQRFVTDCPQFPGRLGFLITSGEEGDLYDLGTPHVMAELKRQGIHLDYCIVGEPSSTQTVGDMIKIGRRGSLHATIQVQGKQGHVAYPHLASNPIHIFSPALAELTQTRWDEGNAYFPPTSMQITQITSGGIAKNVIPGELSLHLNFRFSTEHTEASLKEQVHAIFSKHQLTPTIEWQLSGLPFLTDEGPFVATCCDVIEEHTGKRPVLSTSGGTSDARFIAPYGTEVIELGPVNASIHQINEHVSLNDLIILEQIYYDICKRTLIK